MGRFEIGLASVMGVLVLGILVLINASPDSTPSGISSSIIEMTMHLQIPHHQVSHHPLLMTKNYAMNEESGEMMMEEEMMESGEMMMEEEMMESGEMMMEEEMMESGEMMMEEEMMESGEEDISDTAFVSMPPGSGTPACAQTDECFIPFNAEIISGGTVTWNNDDVAVHTVTSGIASKGPDGIFDSSIISPGSTFEHTFEDSGTYDYFCIVHPWMIGIVQVQ